MKERPSNRAVVLTTMLVALLCMTLTAILCSIAPPAKTIPRWLEYWIAYGWVTGWYLSVSFLSIRWILSRFLPRRAMECHDIAHGFQLPVVVGGVGTWAIVKALGYL
jgi:hypothetical protein